MPTVVPDPLPVLPTTWTLDKRQVVGAALGLVCLGIIIGFRFATDGEPLVVERSVPVFTKAPCADCEERAKANHPSATGGVEAVPGDSSVPED